MNIDENPKQKFKNTCKDVQNIYKRTTHHSQVGLSQKLKFDLILRKKSMCTSLN